MLGCNRHRLFAHFPNITCPRTYHFLFSVLHFPGLPYYYSFKVLLRDTFLLCDVRILSISSHNSLAPDILPRTSDITPRREHPDSLKPRPLAERRAYH